MAGAGNQASARVTKAGAERIVTKHCVLLIKKTRCAVVMEVAADQTAVSARGGTLEPTANGLHAHS